jgi:hypothetical protein
MNELDLLKQFQSKVPEPSSDAWRKARAAISAARADAIAASPGSGLKRPAWRRGRPLAALLGVTGAVAAAAVAALLVLTAGSAPTSAFAGWSADPTPKSSGQVHAAESECRRNSQLASRAPTLADVRGPFTLLVYAGDSGGLCITGPSLLSPTNEPPFAPFGVGGTTTTASLSSDVIQPTVTGGLTTRATAEFTFNVGRAGANVTAVTLTLQNGNRVAATTSNGWFAAWWPGGQAAQTANVTTASGTATQQLIPSDTQNTGKP